MPCAWGVEGRCSQSIRLAWRCKRALKLRPCAQSTILSRIALEPTLCLSSHVNNVVEPAISPLTEQWSYTKRLRASKSAMPQSLPTEDQGTINFYSHWGHNCSLLSKTSSGHNHNHQRKNMLPILNTSNGWLES